jgi:hypothetical protein
MSLIQTKVCQETHQQEEVEEVHQAEEEEVAVVGGGLPPIIPAAPPTLDDLTRLVNDIGIALGQLATQVTLMAA